jgi:hypothetical protein
MSLSLVESASVGYASSYGASSYGAAAAPHVVQQPVAQSPVLPPVQLHNSYSAPEPVAVPAQAPVVPQVEVHNSYSAPVAQAPVLPPVEQPVVQPYAPAATPAPAPVVQYGEAPTPALEVVQPTVPLEIITTPSTLAPVAELFVPETTTAYVPPVQYEQPIVQSYFSVETTTTTTPAPVANFVAEVQYVNDRPSYDVTEAPLLTVPTSTVGQVAYGQVESKTPEFVTEYVPSTEVTEVVTEELLTTPEPPAAPALEVRNARRAKFEKIMHKMWC